MTTFSLILFLVVLFLGVGIYFFMAALLRGKKSALPQTPLEILSAEQKQRRDEAIAKFHQIHNTARDHRHKVAQVVGEDAVGAAQIVGKMLKR